MSRPGHREAGHREAGHREAGRDALVVVNPAAGGSPLVLADEVAELLASGGYEPRILTTSHRGEAIVEVAAAVCAGAAPIEDPAAARGGGKDSDVGRHGDEGGIAVHGLGLVLAVGGDGTAREVAEGVARGLGNWPGGPGLADRRVQPPAVSPALLVVPGGTGNSLYRALFADASVKEVLGMVMDPGHPGVRLRHLDLGYLVELDRGVVLGASAGFLAAVLDVAGATTDLQGRQRYEQAAIRLIGHPEELGAEVRVLVDGEPMAEGRLLLAAMGGARHRGGSFELLPRSVLDDGMLDVCAIAMPPGDRAGAVERLGQLFVEVLGGRHLEEPEVAYSRGESVVIEALRARGDEDTGRVHFEYDGELVEGGIEPGGSLTCTVIPGAVPIWAGDPPLAG